MRALQMHMLVLALLVASVVATTTIGCQGQKMAGRVSIEKVPSKGGKDALNQKLPSSLEELAPLPSAHAPALVHLWALLNELALVRDAVASLQSDAVLAERGKSLTDASGSSCILKQPSTDKNSKDFVLVWKDCVFHRGPVDFVMTGQQRVCLTNSGRNACWDDKSGAVPTLAVIRNDPMGIKLVNKKESGAKLPAMLGFEQVISIDFGKDKTYAVRSQSTYTPRTETADTTKPESSSDPQPNQSRQPVAWTINFLGLEFALGREDASVVNNWYVTLLQPGELTMDKQTQPKLAILAAANSDNTPSVLKWQLACGDLRPIGTIQIQRHNQSQPSQVELSEQGIREVGTVNTNDQRRTRVQKPADQRNNPQAAGISHVGRADPRPNFQLNYHGCQAKPTTTEK